jgi:hypothetical protein
LLTSVSVANARRAKTLMSVQHLNRNYPAEIVDVHKQNEFIQSSLAAKAFTSCPNELRTSKSYLRAIPTIFFYLSLLKVFTPKHPFCQSRQHQAIQLWLYLLQFTIYSFGGTAHWFNRHRDSARSHSRFTFDHGSRIFQSLPTKNQSAIC